MAAYSFSDEAFEEAFYVLKKALKISDFYEDQKKLIKAFCNGQNIHFSAATGYGKSAVFQSIPWVYDIVNEQVVGTSTLIVISPLRSLMEDQVRFLKSTGISAIALHDKSEDLDKKLRDLEDGIYSLVYASPECMLEKNIWRKVLSSDAFRDHCIGVVYDEAHIIAQWGSADEQSRSPFRRWYSRMLEFRTLLAPNVQFGLFTATLTRAAKHKVFSMLDIDETQILCIENTPLKQNIRYSVQYINNDCDLKLVFKFILDDLKSNGPCAKKCLIYCQTRKQCALIYHLFISELGDHLYSDEFNNPKYRIVEMYHAGTPEPVKGNIVKELTSEVSHLRVLMCTIAFGMGINCKGIHECIHFGAPQNIESYIQESGRIGRDGKTSVSRIFYSNTLLRGCDSKIRDYISTKTCRTKELMKHFHIHEQSQSEKAKCSCCDNCTQICHCSDNSCHSWSVVPNKPICSSRTRTVSSEAYTSLKEKLYVYSRSILMKYEASIIKIVSIPNIYNEFGSYQINQVLDNCDKMFTLPDVYNHVEIWRNLYANNVLSILHDIFGDIEEDIGDLSEASLYNSLTSNFEDDWTDIQYDSDLADLMWDSSIAHQIDEAGDCLDESEQENKTLECF